MTKAAETLDILISNHIDALDAADRNSRHRDTSAKHHAATFAAGERKERATAERLAAKIVEVLAAGIPDGHTSRGFTYKLDNDGELVRIKAMTENP